MSRAKILLPNGRIIERVPQYRASMIMNSSCMIAYKGKKWWCHRASETFEYEWSVDAEFYEACGYSSEFWGK